MEKKIGFLTIGQSPREDVVPEIARLLGKGVRILERGALDGLSKPEVQSLRPKKGDFLLVTRLRDGSTATVEKRRIAPLLRKQIRRLEDQQVRLIALLCTDEFPRLGPREKLLQPSRLLLQSAAILKKGKLGIFVPLESQKAPAKRKWKKTGKALVIEALNPYQESPEQGEAIERMRSAGVDLIVLDCIGYSLKMAKKIRLITGVPVLCPRAVLASAIKEFI